MYHDIRGIKKLCVYVSLSDYMGIIADVAVKLIRTESFDASTKNKKSHLL